MAFNLEEKIVLVAGANRGIGKAIVEEALHRGAAKVYAAVRNVDTAAPLVAKHGARVVPIRVDLNDPASIIAAPKAASDVDVVVNNAGVMKMRTALDADAIDTLQFEMESNVYGLIRVAQAFAPVLKANGGGALVQLNSVASVRTMETIATYCASKAASYAITQGLRDSLREQGTVVVSVHPGPIKTDMAENAGFGDVAVPASVVAVDLFDALAEERFLVWPDPKAERIGAAYESFAMNVITPDRQESLV